MLSRLSIALMLAAASTAVGAQTAVTPAPQRFLIERDIPGGRELGPVIQWVHRITPITTMLDPTTASRGR